MSTADWPAAWGKQHEALCAFRSIQARRLSDGNVELWLSGSEQMRKSCIGVVPERISHTTLQALVSAMVDSYQRGFVDGRAELAAAVLDPIRAVLRTSCE